MDESGHDKFLADISVSEVEHTSSDRFASCKVSSPVRVGISDYVEDVS